MAYDMENVELADQIDELLDELDTIINDIGEIIMGIADVSPCDGCIETAKSLWRIMEDHAREEDAADILEQFAYKTGVSLNDD